MAGMTQAQSIKLTQDELQKGVIEVMVKESKLLQLLPFMNIQGSGYTYNLLGKYGTAEFRPINGGKTQIESFDVVPQTEVLARIINEAVIDNFLVQVESNINDLMAIEVELKAKDMAYTYEKCFINGDGLNNTFEGLLKKVEKYKTLIGIGEEGIGVDQTIVATASLEDDLDELLDMVQGGADAIVLNKKMRRNLTKSLRDKLRYAPLEAVKQLGLQIEYYGTVAIITVDEDILQDDYIIAVKFGIKEAVCGLQNGSIQVRDLGELETLPQSKTRMEWYCSMACFNPKAVAVRVPAYE